MHALPTSRTPRAMLLMLVVVACHAGSARGQAATEPPPAAPTAPATPAVESINKEFLDRELDPSKWVARFEVESREIFTARESIVAALGLKAGDRIADVGSGTGLFLRDFSRLVGPTGRVYAVDISPRLVEFIEGRIRDEQLGNVAVVLSTEDSTQLAPGSVSRAFVCDAYHHFERYPAMLASMFEALRPGGELVIVDFEKIPGTTREWLMTHVRADKATVRDEVVAAGFAFVDEIDVKGLSENYMLRFRRPDVPAAPRP